MHSSPVTNDKGILRNPFNSDEVYDIHTLALNLETGLDFSDIVLIWWYIWKQVNNSKLV